MGIEYGGKRPERVDQFSERRRADGLEGARLGGGEGIRDEDLSKRREVTRILRDLKSPLFYDLRRNLSNPEGTDTLGARRLEGPTGIPSASSQSAGATTQSAGVTTPGNFRSGPPTRSEVDELLASVQPGDRIRGLRHAVDVLPLKDLHEEVKRLATDADPIVAQEAQTLSRVVLTIGGVAARLGGSVSFPEGTLADWLRRPEVERRRHEDLWR